VALPEPPPSASRLDVEAAIKTLKTLRANRRKQGLLSLQEIRAMIEEGRR
jgi:hypothetical protein